ncbi:hypothetical protein [Streptomyces cavernicola]|uniref:Secreted protein n=1 Tax=Streptomyces cavernicola TaxID=3043613 RepID=A0ABT6S5W8_9ACTN|nr:hypothetical protein [Streptomyces sp. B-S-A6]MDI3403490.1 hypothetical protein [Streptomyces sp. B-S-A6]
MIKLRHALLASGVAAGVLFAGAAPSHAQEAGASTSVNSAARAAVGWDWYTKNKIVNVDLAVDDTKADGHRAYARLVTKTRGGTVVRYSKRWVTGGAGDGNHYNNLQASDSRGIAAATIEVCIDDAGADTCELAGWKYNEIG